MRLIFSMKNLNVIGISTHLSCSDSRLTEDAVFTKRQIERFYQLIDELKRSGITVPKLHMQSSYVRAVLISSDTEDEISASALAESSGSISNELLCRMGARLPVVVK